MHPFATQPTADAGSEAIVQSGPTGLSDARDTPVRVAAHASASHGVPVGCSSTTPVAPVSAMQSPHWQTGTSPVAPSSAISDSCGSMSVPTGSPLDVRMHPLRRAIPSDIASDANDLGRVGDLRFSTESERPKSTKQARPRREILVSGQIESTWQTAKLLPNRKALRMLRRQSRGAARDSLCDLLRRDLAASIGTV